MFLHHDFIENGIIRLECELDNLFAVIPPLQNVLEPVRQAFDVFFQRYPYCYGYWKKYADIEKKHGNIQDAEEVNINVIWTRVAFPSYTRYLAGSSVLISSLIIILH